MSESVVGQPFLTALSDQAAPGSRDPLGLQPVWSRMGRMVVGNVTTVSADLQGWITLLVATGATEWIHEDSSLYENEFFETFLRLER